MNCSFDRICTEREGKRKEKEKRKKREKRRKRKKRRERRERDGIEYHSSLIDLMPMIAN